MGFYLPLFSPHIPLHLINLTTFPTSLNSDPIKTIEMGFIDIGPTMFTEVQVIDHVFILGLMARPSP